MPINKSVEAFTCGGLNCAQAVLKGFQEIKDVDESRISEARAYGGGRAEEGRCGALHGALMITDEPQIAEELKREFSAAVGAESCREIKTIHKTPCAKCVEIAASLVQDKICSAK